MRRAPQKNARSCSSSWVRAPLRALKEKESDGEGEHYPCTRRVDHPRGISFVRKNSDRVMPDDEGRRVKCGRDVGPVGLTCGECKFGTRKMFLFTTKGDQAYVLGGDCNRRNDREIALAQLTTWLALPDPNITAFCVLRLFCCPCTSFNRQENISSHRTLLAACVHAANIKSQE